MFLKYLVCDYDGTTMSMSVCIIICYHRTLYPRADRKRERGGGGGGA